MTGRGAAAQGGLAAVGLLAALSTWQREPERAAGEVTVLDTSLNQLERVRYDDGKRWVELRPGGGKEGDPPAWIKIAATPDGKQPERELRGNESAEKLLKNFAPLRAARALGTFDAAKRKELGLDANTRKIEISARGEKRQFLVSAVAVGAPYLEDERDKRVYLLGGSVVNDLDAASTRLIDRSLHDFKTSEFDALTITAGGKKRELVQTAYENPMNARLASKATPAKPDARAKNWHDKLFRLPPIETFGRGEAIPGAGANPEVILRVEYTKNGRQVGWIEFTRVASQASPPAASMSTPEQPQPKSAEIFARSEHTVGWMKLTGSADDVIKEAEKVVAGE